MLIIGFIAGVIASFVVTKVVMPAVNASLGHHHDRIEAEGPRVNGILVDTPSDRIRDLAPFRARRNRDVPVMGNHVHDDVPLTPEHADGF